MKKIKEIDIRNDKTIVLTTKKDLILLFPDGDSEVFDKRTGKPKPPRS